MAVACGEFGERDGDLVACAVTVCMLQPLTISEAEESRNRERQVRSPSSYCMGDSPGGPLWVESGGAYPPTLGRRCCTAGTRSRYIPTW